MSVIDYEPQCWRCRRVLGGSMARPWNVKCRRCKALNYSKPEWMELDKRDEAPILND